MRIAFLAGDIAGISGGANVIIEHSHALVAAGHEVDILTPRALTRAELKWQPKADTLRILPLGAAPEATYDFAFATWWLTFFDLPKVNARVYGYFNQSLESRFHEEDHYKRLNRLTYSLPLLFVTEARWLETFIRSLQPNARTLLIPNGLSQTWFPCARQITPPAEDGVLRVLVEGPAGVRFKGVTETFEVLKAAAAHGVKMRVGWLSANTQKQEHTIGGERVEVHERIPISQVAKVLGRYDVMVKLSRVEGMFGPPLEMFSQGGTAITHTVTGSDEYMVHGYNGYVVPPHDRGQIVHYLKKLADDPQRLAELKQNALATARKYPGWDVSGAAFARALEQLHAEGYTNAELRSSLASLAAAKTEWLEAQWSFERGVANAPAGTDYVGPGERVLLKQYRRLKSSREAQVIKELVPKQMRRRIREYFMRTWQ